MTFQEEIAELQARIGAARAERDAGQAAGVQQNYFEACHRVEALEGELEGLRQQGLRAFATQKVMTELGIALRDGTYQIRGRRFARLADAVSWARLLRRRLAA